MPGEPSQTLAWEAVAAAAPEVVVVMPCGYDAPRAHAEALAHAEQLAALGARAVVAVDASAYFSRPGPRLIDGLELLAHILHPGRVARPRRARARWSALSRVSQRAASPLSVPAARAEATARAHRGTASAQAVGPAAQRRRRRFATLARRAIEPATAGRARSPRRRQRERAACADARRAQDRAPRAAPPISPPMCPPQEMPGSVKLMIRLITISPPMPPSSA